MVAGQVPPKPPWDWPPSRLSVCGSFLSAFWWWVNSATASAWLGIAPMKKADCAVSVVPVLAMISWPLLIAAAVPVPPATVSTDIAYWTCESISAFCIGLLLNTRLLVTLIGICTLFWVSLVTRCCW
jgi:hypothetical protein